MSYDFNRSLEYEFTVYEHDLKTAPQWESKEQFPPLSPRKAESSVKKMLSDFVEDSEKWGRTGISLRQLGEESDWVYIVHLIGFHPSGVIDGPVSTIRIVVLMDGTAIVPDIVKHK